MAWKTLGITPVPVTNLAAQKENFLRMMNLLPGVEYSFEGRSLYWKVRDYDQARAFYKWQGFPEEVVEMQIRNIEKNPIAENYEFHYKRFNSYREAFHQVFGAGLPSASVPVEFLYSNSINAGATPLEDGSSIITVAASMSNLQRWIDLRQFLDHFFPVFKRMMSGEGGEIKLTSEDMSALSACLQALQALARIIVGNLKTEAGSMAHAARILAVFENIRHQPDYQEMAREYRSEWHMAEVFLLCHEFGHINLGHLEEVREWHRKPSSDEQTQGRRIARRRQMEYDADSYAFAHAILLMTYLFDKEYHDLAAAEKDPHMLRDYVLPVLDLMTIYACGLSGMYHYDEKTAEYPSNEDRMRYLLSKGTDGSNPMIRFLMWQLEFITGFGDEPRSGQGA